MGSVFNKNKKKKKSNVKKVQEDAEQPKQNYPQEPEWMKYAIPVTRQDTSGRIALLFYGPCYSGKSALFKYIEGLPNFKSRGAMIGVAYCKRPEKIKEKEVMVDSYDIGSYNGNEERKKFFIERCNLFIIVLDPTKENCIKEVQDCIDKIKSRNNKDPCKFCLCATKMDLINDDNKKILEDVENNFKEYKFYKLSKDSGDDIKKMYDEFIEESYDDIKNTLHGIDDLDVY